MDNGNNTTVLSPIRALGICLTVTGFIGGYFQIELVAIREEMDRRTDSRYRAGDAARDFRLVEFRFERNEQNIQECLEFIKWHREIHQKTHPEMHTQ